MVSNNIKFFKIKSIYNLKNPLKTFNDSLLFYYLGHLALKNQGDILEIGGGGSSYLLYELSEKSDRPFTLCDLNPKFTDYHLPCFSSAKVNPIIGKSEMLPYKSLLPFSYCHIDGDKDYSVTLNDLNYCLTSLAKNGLLCQDDYGNNKFPTVSQAVYKVISENKAKIILVGDSSIWLTKPEYYDYWMQVLDSDYEFNLLSSYIGIQESDKQLSYTPRYFFLNSMRWLDESTIRYSKTKFTEEELKFLNTIHKYQNDSFLKMPYLGQSSSGFWL